MLDPSLMNATYMTKKYRPSHSKKPGIANLHYSFQNGNYQGALTLKLQWNFTSTQQISIPNTAALESSLNLLLVGPYHALAGKLEGVPWEKCVLHYRYYYDPPETLTVLSKDGDEGGFHIGYFRCVLWSLWT